ncbi:unnamed protein product [Rhizoctonia solani]|uniref:Vegetative incompatibility protein HET-E-1 n=1 Tax=Rhizoctonia solani TaxID=456999 RepID=A0A8H3DN02_9AGAM|nr:unnamed protein product [Rhizoctonia solani]
MQPHMKPGVLRKVVGRLGAVVYSDGNLAGAIRVLHPSFADFALDEARSSIFWVSPIDRNIEVSVGCMSTMEHELRFNICDLETSHLLNSEVPDLESKIEANISGQLAYSCVYWINHLVGCEDEAAAGLVANILDNPRLLYWLEVLSVLRRVDVAVKGLRELSRWLMTYQRDIAHYVWDAYKFVFAFSDPIVASAPHIYISALPLAPRQSEVSRRLLSYFSNTAVVKGGDETWPKWLRSIPLPAPLCLMCVSRDSQRLVVSTSQFGLNETISIFDLRTGGLLRVLERSSVKHQSEFVAISPDGSLVASGSTYGGISLWDADVGTLIRAIHVKNFDPLKDSDHKLRTVAFSSDGTALRLLTDDSQSLGLRFKSETEIKIWEIEPRSGTEHLPFQVSVNTGFITGATFSPDGAQVAVSPGMYLVIYSCSNSTDRVRINWNLYFTNTIVFSPDGALIAAVLSSLFELGCVQIWDTKTGASVAVFTEHITEPLSFAFSSDGTQMVTRTRTGMRIRDTKVCATIGSPFGVDISNCADALVFFSPDDAYILSGRSGDTRIQIWDISSISVPVNNDLDIAYTLQHIKHPNAVQFLQVWFSPDGTCILSGSSTGTIRTWDAQTGAPISEAYAGLLDAQHDISMFAVSPEGNRLVTGNNPFKEMTVWDISTGTVIKTLSPLAADGQSGPERIIFSFNGSHMVSCHAQSSLVPGRMLHLLQFELKVCIWDLGTYSLVGSWSPQVGNNKPCDTPAHLPRVHAVSPNATSLASSYVYGNKIFIHDTHTRKITATLVNKDNRIVNCVAFSPCGNWVASSYDEKTIRLWEVTSGTVIGNHVFNYVAEIRSLAFSPDGTKLVASSGDVIRVWNVGIDGISDPWRKDSPSHWPPSAHCFPPHPIHSGWVSHDQKSLTLWLPDHYRREYEPRLLLRISEEPVVHIDFSKFVHGTDWVFVISEGALRSCRKPNAI